MEFQMDYTFKDSDFLGGSMHIYLHRSPDVDVHYGLNDSFLAGDVSTQRISLKQGYVFPSVSTTKDASYEDKEKAVNMLNYCIEQLYEETAKIHNDLKLF